MTCDEVHALYKSGRRVTYEEAVAVIAHFAECLYCQEILSSEGPMDEEIQQAIKDVQAGVFP
jgi:hypothetical protein